MIFGIDCAQLELKRIGEIPGLMSRVQRPEKTDGAEFRVENCVPPDNSGTESRYALRIAVYS